MVSRKDRTVTRQNLADAVSRTNGMSRAQASELVGQVIDAITETLVQGEPVLLSGFGKFVVASRAPRRARNVRAGHEMIIDARNVLVFKPSAGLIDHLTESLPGAAAPARRDRADRA